MLAFRNAKIGFLWRHLGMLVWVRTCQKAMQPRWMACCFARQRQHTDWQQHTYWHRHPHLSGMYASTNTRTQSRNNKI